MSPTIWISWAVAGVVALGSPFLLNKLLARAGVIDLPNERSSHERPTLRGGGVAQLLALLLGGLTAWLGLTGPGQRLLLVVVIAASAAGILGLVEDARGVPIAVRAGVQMLIGLVLGALVVQVLNASWWWVPISALAFAAYVNFANFMDGINGISSLHGLVVGATFAATGIVLNATWLTVSGVLLGIAFVTFLPWNLTPPGVFLGDVGSYLLGATIAGIGIAAVVSGIPVIAVVAPVSMYLADTLTVILKRALRGERWYTPHRGHVYQRLVAAGQPHVRVALAVAAFSLAAGVVGVLSVTQLLEQPAVAWVIVMALVASYLGLGRAQRVASGRVA